MDIFKKMRFKNVSPIKGIIRTRSDRCYRCIGRHIDFQNARNIIAGLFKVRVWVVAEIKAHVQIVLEKNAPLRDRKEEKNENLVFQFVLVLQRMANLQGSGKRSVQYSAALIDLSSFAFLVDYQGTNGKDGKRRGFLCNLLSCPCFFNR